MTKRKAEFGARAGEWAERGRCRTTDPEGFFVQGADQNRIKTFCVSCPVRLECLADALDNDIEFGVWGGLTERERRQMRRRNPDLVDWLPVLREQAACAAESETGS